MDNIVDVDYNVTSDNKSYYDLEEATKILGVEEHNIVYWCNKFNDILKIKSVGQHHIFDTYDIKNLKIIKEYNLTKGMSIREIREQLSKSQEIILKTEIDTVEVSMINVFAKIMNMQNQKIDELANTQSKLLKLVEDLSNSQIESRQSFENILKEVSVDIEKQQETIINKITEQLSNESDDTRNKVLQSEHERKDRDTELITMLRKSQKDQQKIIELQEHQISQNNKGFLKKLFNKNK